jgi:hypothetical protein
MALKLTRFRLFALLACASLPAIFLFPWSHIVLPDFSFFPSSNTVPPALTITNNNATYPTLSFNQSHSQYADQANLILDRLQSRRNLLFGGAVNDLNNAMLDSLQTLLRAQSDDYVPPRVRVPMIVFLLFRTLSIYRSS